ncbi:hypothetical protein [Limosilactobacillus gastricus]|uniref:hypothetical protein n=1 Tax=Limosilactobacillus gastricus TaxID=227942 RepID=UPI0002EB6779|nr:hypothetical protein [Limosilactobacillus gastricus]
MKEMERARLEDQLGQLTREKQRRVDSLDDLPGQVAQFDNDLLTELYGMQSQGNPVLGRIFEQVQAEQTNFRRQVTDQIEKLEGDYRQKNRQIQNQINQG